MNKSWRELVAEDGGLKTTPEPVQSPASNQSWRELVAQDQIQSTPPNEEPSISFGKRLKNFVTGEDRDTPESLKTPSLVDVGVDKLLGKSVGAKRKAVVSAALATATDPLDIFKIIESNTPEQINLDRDNKGNFYLNIGSGNDRRRVIINKPGLDKLDAAQFGALTAAFTPSGNTAKAAKTVLGAAAKVGAASAATQAGIDVAQQAAGREKDVSLSNIRKSDVALTGVAAGASEAAFQGLFKALGKIAPNFFKNVSQSGIKPKDRASIKKAAIESGLNPDDITDDVIKNFTKAAETAVNPEDLTSTALETEFGVPDLLTRGQRTLNQKQLSTEDSFRAGSRGERAQNIMLGKEAKQATQLKGVSSNLQEGIAGINPVIDGRKEAGESLKEAVRSAEESASKAVGDAYASVTDASLSVPGFKNVLNSMKASMRGVEFDKSLKETSKVLSGIDDFQKTLSTKGLNIRPYHIQKLEQMRRRLNTAMDAADNLSDRRQVKIMQKAFDDSLDKAVINGLFEGDDASLDALKQARSISSDYFKKFTSQPIKTRKGSIQDPAGKFIEKIVEADPSGDEVVNSLFSSGSFNKASSVHLAKRYKQIIGADSEGWSAVRQSAFKNLIKTNKVNGEEIISGQQTMKAIDKALTDNASLMEELFTKTEIGKIRRFALLVKRTQPDLAKSRETPSGKAMFKEGGEILKYFLPAGILSGEPVTQSVAGSAIILKNLKNFTSASKTVKPFSHVKNVPGVLPAATTTISTQGSKEEQ